MQVILNDANHKPFTQESCTVTNIIPQNFAVLGKFGFYCQCLQSFGAFGCLYFRIFSYVLNSFIWESACCSESQVSSVFVLSEKSF